MKGIDPLLVFIIFDELTHLEESEEGDGSDDYEYRGSYSPHSEDAERPSGCFIATAVYGSPDHPNVESLRNYRDDVLTSSLLGRQFIRFYYSGAGEAAAEFIKNKLPEAIPFIRSGLDLLVENYSKDNITK